MYPNGQPGSVLIHQISQTLGMVQGNQHVWFNLMLLLVAISAALVVPSDPVMVDTGKKTKHL